ncbi:hypothetical protein X797_000539 [Metarhizium robertsii]|uniref:Uncharacterized protein n=1 Tax=Metarhizium robertsii TaxID=568076 RepID=A0A0A1V6F0_9HYPO|nr:hypothetical protein X797_000539 [Metarhizium robertsii]
MHCKTRVQLRSMAAQSGVQQVLVDHLTIQPDAGPKLRSRPGNAAAGAESRRAPSSVGPRGPKMASSCGLHGQAQLDNMGLGMRKLEPGRLNRFLRATTSDEAQDG